MRHEGVTKLVGSVISTPCSIVMSNRDQTVDFSSLTLTMLSTAVAREQQTRPFDIELRDCGSVYSTLDSKTWTIRFDGQGADNIDAFALQGPSQGLGVSVLDNTKNIVIPGETYPLFDSVLRQGQSGANPLFALFFTARADRKAATSRTLSRAGSFFYRLSIKHRSTSSMMTLRRHSCCLWDGTEHDVQT
ncbi:fimbrial protein StdA [Providencia stuartii]|nr:fimbrial protein StdA [Providencia stuartii]